MTSPKTVTPDQPQAVPVAWRIRQNGLSWLYWDADEGREPPCMSAEPLYPSPAGIETEPGDGDTPWDRAYNAGFRKGLAARPVLPVETPAEGLREAVAWRRMNRMRTQSTGVTDVQYFAQQWTKEGDHVEPLYTTPAPLSGMDGSSREADVEAAAKAVHAVSYLPETWPNHSRAWRDRCRKLASAALAAVPPETAEMEGGSFRTRARGWLFFQQGAMLPADRLAARASSSGEAGDE